MLGGLLEIVVALAGIATAVVLFPVLKRQDEGLSLGLVASQPWKPAPIFLGVAFLLSVRHLAAGRSWEQKSLVTSRTLVTLYERIFLLGQSFMPAINNLILGYLLYKSRLVPHALSLIGLVGGPVLIAGYLAVLFGLVGQHDPG